MIWETRKILEDPDIQVNPTCVRVPVYLGHSEALHIETREKLTVAQTRKLLSEAPGWLSWTARIPVTTLPRPPRLPTGMRFTWDGFAKTFPILGGSIFGW